MHHTNGASSPLTGLGLRETLKLIDRPAGRLDLIPVRRIAEGGTLTASATGVSFRPGELEARPDGTGNLLGSRCRACGAYFFPVREACSGCLSGDLETVKFSTEGVLYTFSIVRQSIPAFEVPYALGYVDFPENVRIMGQISGCDFDDIKIGMAMELSLEPFGTDDEGNDLIGYRFRPVEAHND